MSISVSCLMTPKESFVSCQLRPNVPMAVLSWLSINDRWMSSA